MAFRPRLGQLLACRLLPCLPLFRFGGLLAQGRLERKSHSCLLAARRFRILEFLLQLRPVLPQRRERIPALAVAHHGQLLLLLLDQLAQATTLCPSAFELGLHGLQLRTQTLDKPFALLRFSRSRILCRRAALFAGFSWSSFSLALVVLRERQLRRERPQPRGDVLLETSVFYDERRPPALICRQLVPTLSEDGGGLAKRVSCL